MKIIWKVFKAVGKVFLAAALGLAIIIALGCTIAAIIKVVEIWVGAELIFQVIAVLFLMAVTQPRPGPGTGVDARVH